MCMCVCMRVCIRVCIVCAYVHECMCVYVRACVCVYCVCVYLCVCISVCVLLVCAYVHVCMSKCVRVHASVCVCMWCCIVGRFCGQKVGKSSVIGQSKPIKALRLYSPIYSPAKLSSYINIQEFTVDYCIFCICSSFTLCQVLV